MRTFLLLTVFSVLCRAIQIELVNTSSIEVVEVISLNFGEAADGNPAIGANGPANLVCTPGSTEDNVPQDASATQDFTWSDDVPASPATASLRSALFDVGGSDTATYSVAMPAELVGAKNFGVEAWVKLERRDTTDFDATTTGYAVSLDGPDIMVAMPVPDGRWGGTNLPVDPSLYGTWVRVTSIVSFTTYVDGTEPSGAFDRDSEMSFFFINGELMRFCGTDVPSAEPFNCDPVGDIGANVYIGGTNIAGSGWKGYLDNVKVFTLPARNAFQFPYSNPVGPAYTADTQSISVSGDASKMITSFWNGEVIITPGEEFRLSPTSTIGVPVNFVPNPIGFPSVPSWLNFNADGTITGTAPADGFEDMRITVRAESFWGSTHNYAALTFKAGQANAGAAGANGGGRVLDLEEDSTVTGAMLGTIVVALGWSAAILLAVAAIVLFLGGGGIAYSGKKGKKGKKYHLNGNKTDKEVNLSTVRNLLETLIYRFQHFALIGMIGTMPAFYRSAARMCAAVAFIVNPPWDDNSENAANGRPLPFTRRLLANEEPPEGVGIYGYLQFVGMGPEHAFVACFWLSSVVIAGVLVLTLLVACLGRRSSVGTWLLKALNIMLGIAFVGLVTTATFTFTLPWPATWLVDKTEYNWSRVLSFIVFILLLVWFLGTSAHIFRKGVLSEKMGRKNFDARWGSFYEEYNAHVSIYLNKLGFINVYSEKFILAVTVGAGYREPKAQAIVLLVVTVLTFGRLLATRPFLLPLLNILHPINTFLDVVSYSLVIVGHIDIGVNGEDVDHIYALIIMVCQWLSIVITAMCLLYKGAATVLAMRSQDKHLEVGAQVMAKYGQAYKEGTVHAVHGDSHTYDIVFKRYGLRCHRPGDTVVSLADYEAGKFDADASTEEEFAESEEMSMSDMSSSANMQSDEESSV